MDLKPKYFLEKEKENLKLDVVDNLKLPEDSNIEITYTNEKVILLLNRNSEATLNGYALSLQESYELKDSDRIVLTGDVVYKVCREKNKRRNSDDDNNCGKKMRVASIFDKCKNVLAKNNSLNSFKFEGNWQCANDLLTFSHESVQHSSKIASFDLDGTLIKTKSGQRFPTNENDWELLTNNIKKEIQNYYNKDFKIVIFTNQAGLGKDICKINPFKEKICNIITTLSVPAQIFISLKKSIYRKPAPGMWNAFLSMNGGIEVDKNESFYVGDAAGRPKNWAPKKKKDHSSADRLFALNIGLKFFTPEEFFEKAKAVPFEMPKFNPQKLTMVNDKFDLPDSQELVVMFGSPGSGKSTFCKKHLLPNGYVHVNRDKLGSWQKCLELVEKSLKEKRSVVVDNTNKDIETRKKYIDCAKKFNVPTRCFVMDISKEHCMHNNKFREFTDTTHNAVGDVIIHSYFKNCVPPTKSEGFTDVVKLRFNPHFGNSKDEQLYRMFLLDN